MMIAYQASLVRIPQTRLYLMEQSREYTKGQRKDMLKNNSAEEPGGKRFYLVEQPFSIMALYLNRIRILQLEKQH